MFGKTMKHVATLLTLAGMTLAGSVTLASARTADRQAIAGDAIRCAGLFQILTSVSASEPDFGKVMTVFAGAMTDIYAVYTKERTGTTVTNGEASRARSEAMRNLALQYDRNPQEAEAIFLQCFAWREDIARHFLAHQDKLKSDAKRVYLSMPRMPVSPPADIAFRQEIAQVVKIGFEEWASLGRITPDVAHESLRRALENASGRNPVPPAISGRQ
jgi:hypothetical protein